MSVLLSADENECYGRNKWDTIVESEVVGLESNELFPRKPVEKGEVNIEGHRKHP